MDGYEWTDERDNTLSQMDVYSRRTCTLYVYVA